MSQSKDRNFDDLIDRFESRVYDTAKGDWRLQLLTEDLSKLLDSESPLAVWDAGCGFGQLALEFARKNHDVTLCDISEKMLNRAKQLFEENNLCGDFYHQSAQQLAGELTQFDLLLFHAVIEWLAEPQMVLQQLLDSVKPGGYLSLLFYNRNAMVYANVLKGHWRLKPILEDIYIGKGNKLSPPHPQYPHEIRFFLESSGFEIIKHTGIRVFHDYLPEEVKKNTDMDQLFELEKRFCRMPVYSDMGRYVHLLAQRKIM